jgi:hypothetical protein
MLPSHSSRRRRAGLTTLLLAVLASYDPALAGDGMPPADPPSRPVATPPLPPVVVVSGSPGEIGKQLGAAEADNMRAMLRLAWLRSIPVRLLHGRRLEGFIQAIPSAYREEIAACARSAGIDESTLLAANVLVDSQCSALVSPARAGEPLRVARNLDFFPASVVGPRTVVRVVRADGKHAVASLGWPGFAGVTSGMNDSGLTACVLLNRNHLMRSGMPICFCIRDLLENCTTLDQAVERFSRCCVASSHYLLLADAQGAAVVWWDEHGMHRDDPTDGWLAASNGQRRHGLPVDSRGQRLVALGDHLRTLPVDDAAMRQSLTASYLDTLNAQAMVFIPAQLQLQFALGTAFHPAACGYWRAIDLGALLAGEPAASAAITDLGCSVSLPHPLTLR